jgi:hypothetical protein
MNLVQTKDSGDDKIEFAGVSGMSNQDLLYSFSESAHAAVKPKKVETAEFAADLDALAAENDPSFAQKGVRKTWKSLDDNLKVHDLSFDELPNKQNIQLAGWDIEDAMTTQVSNDEILGDVYLPAVEKLDD